jgi:hypothetical protein
MNTLSINDDEFDEVVFVVLVIIGRMMTFFWAIYWGIGFDWEDDVLFF